jgi:hypothetical protein
MKRNVIAGAALVVFLAASSYFSAKIGYSAGLADAPGVTRSPDAAYIVAVLDRIQSGNSAFAVAMLESRLDGCLIDRWVYDRRGHRFWSILRPAEIAAIPALIGVGAQYRAKNPSINASDNTRGAIAEVVAKYAPLAPAQGLPN